MSIVSIRNTTRHTLPLSALTRTCTAITNEMLPEWEISLAFVGPTAARAFNKSLRGKSYIPNVLSYRAGEQNGEIIICVSQAKKEAGSYALSFPDFILLLFIHGLLHLEGREHGVTMEKCEQQLLAKFAKGNVRTYTHVQTHSNRHRHRHVPGQAGRR